MNEIKRLFEVLKEEYDALVHNDLKFLEEDNEHPEELELKDKSAICCDQKMIYWNGEYFLICCLYNSMPTMQYKTIPEVVSFFQSFVEDAKYLNYDRAKTPAEVASQDGFCYQMYENVLMEYETFKKNTHPKMLSFGDDGLHIDLAVIDTRNSD